MSDDILKRLSKALAEAQGLVPADLVFDDQPIGSVLDQESAPDPTPANLLRSADDYVESILWALGRGRLQDAVTLVSWLSKAGHRLSAENYGRLAAALYQLPRQVDQVPSEVKLGSPTAWLEWLCQLAEEQMDEKLFVAAGVPLAFQYGADDRSADAEQIWSKLAEIQRRQIDRRGALTYQQVDAADNWAYEVLTHHACNCWDSGKPAGMSQRYPATARILESIVPRGERRVSSTAADTAKRVSAQIPATPVSPGATAVELVGDRLVALAQPGAFQGETRYAESLRKKAVTAAVVEVAAYPAHPYVALCLVEMASTLSDCEKSLDWVPLLRRAREVAERGLGREHPLVARICNNLGALLVPLGRLDDAEELLLRATQIPPPFPHPYYWLAKLYCQRRRPGDREREIQAWRQYLAREPPSPERAAEGQQRLEQIVIRPG